MAACDTNLSLNLGCEAQRTKIELHKALWTETGEPSPGLTERDFLKLVREYLGRMPSPLMKPGKLSVTGALKGQGEEWLASPGL